MTVTSPMAGNLPVLSLTLIPKMNTEAERLPLNFEPLVVMFFWVLFFLFLSLSTISFKAPHISLKKFENPTFPPYLCYVMPEHVFNMCDDFKMLRYARTCIQYV